MKFNAPTVPPTPPVPSLATTYPLAASHRGNDTLHRTGSLLLKQSSRHNCRSSSLRQGACLVGRSDTASDNYGNVQVRRDLFDHTRFYRVFSPTSCFKVDESHPVIMFGKGVCSSYFHLIV